MRPGRRKTATITSANTLHKHACRSSEKPLASAQPVALVPPDKQSRKLNITSTSVQRSKSILPKTGVKVVWNKVWLGFIGPKESDRASLANFIVSQRCFLASFANIRCHFANKRFTLTNLVQWLALSSNGCSPSVFMGSWLIGNCVFSIGCSYANP